MEYLNNEKPVRKYKMYHYLFRQNLNCRSTGALTHKPEIPLCRSENSASNLSLKN